MPFALVVKERKKMLIEQIPFPKYNSNQLLIKVTHVAQNPTDWKHVHFGLAKSGSIVGCDFTGIVLKIGKDAVGNYKKGERVAGCVHGGLDRENGIPGSFSEYVVQEASLVFRYPRTMSPQSVVTLPLVSITAALGLFHKMGLPLPPANINENLLVWSGSTSVGQCVIQLAKSIGCFVLTTASIERHSYLKSLGADLCFDYKDEHVIDKIHQATNYHLAYAFDCISEKEATKQVCLTLTQPNSQLCTVLPFITSQIPSHIQERRVLIYTIFGYERFLFGQVFQKNIQDKLFAEKFCKLLSDYLLPEGILKPNRVTLIPGGLNGIEVGFKKMMENKIAAEKLVYTLAETNQNKCSFNCSCCF